MKLDPYDAEKVWVQVRKDLPERIPQDAEMKVSTVDVSLRPTMLVLGVFRDTSGMYTAIVVTYHMDETVKEMEYAQAWKLEDIPFITPEAKSLAEAA
jgi:hypothetical protein